MPKFASVCGLKVSFCNLSVTVSTKMKLLVVSIAFIAMLNCAEAQNGTPQTISLLDSINDTMANSMKNQEAYQIQTTMLLSQLASTQAQMASALNQVVLILKGKIFPI